MDTFEPEKRSWIMSRVRSKDTTPEMFVRSALHRAGFRFRLHRRDLPGSPDLVLPKHNSVVFVHGCFWHKHDCKAFRWPKSNVDFWRKKIERNVERDRQSKSKLRKQGWRVHTIWACDLENGTAKVIATLETGRPEAEPDKAEGVS